MRHSFTELEIKRGFTTGVGESGFYWVAVQNRPKDDKSETELGRNLWVDTGEISDKTTFNAGGKGGDWGWFDCYFKKPFSTPPVVLATARYKNDWGQINAAVVSRAHKVTTHGFTLYGRNSACGKGVSGFNWAAFGCVVGCEQFLHQEPPV